MNEKFLERVYGYTQIKEELFLIKKWYLESEQLGDMKKLLTKGVLFYGRPGEGKTLIVREFSKSFNYPIFVIEGNEDNKENEIINIYNKARKEKNAIVIIDELDRLVDRDEKLVRILQSQLDGIKDKGNILTLSTANKIRDLPEALLREGRFDRKFNVSPDNKEDFKKIIIGLSKDAGLIFTEDEYIELSEELFQYSVSTIRATFNSARLRFGEHCSIDNVLNTIDFIDRGFMSKQSKDSISYLALVHESGHALYLQKYCKTQTFSRICFNSEGGRTVTKDLIDKQTDESYIETIRCSLAGIAAEEIILGKHSIGCNGDLSKATLLSFELLNENGYQNVDYACESSGYYFRKNISSHTSNVFDKRVAKFVKKNYKLVHHQLNKYKKEIKRIADYLAIHQSIKNIELINLLKEGQ